MSKDEVAIKVTNVSKDFVLPHEKQSSVKQSLINLKGRRTKEVQHALKDINFEVKKGEFFGIVGRNGSGKSTLLKILAGIYQPTSGEVEVEGSLVPFIELGVGFNPELSGRDNVYLNGALLGFSREQIGEMYEDIVEFAELERFMDQKLKNYSSGMQVRLAFSIAVKAESDILLIDEVLAVGDADFQRKCFEHFKMLKKNNSTVVFVSHDMSAIREFCDKAILIDNSKVASVGKPPVIADEYSQLFMENEVIENETVSEKKLRLAKRRGSGKLKIDNVKVGLVEENVEVRVQAKAKSNVDDGIMYGLHVNSQDGEELTAMNNRMLRLADVGALKKGDTVEFVWTMLNVFNDGKYSVTLTLVNDIGVTYDWLIDAAWFEVKRAERSTTAVLPPVEVHYSINE